MLYENNKRLHISGDNRLKIKLRMNVVPRSTMNTNGETEN